VQKKAKKIIENAFVVGECLICCLTPSQAYANIKGYGKVHRFIWEAMRGPIPSGYFVCHTCDVPRCINIDHLFLGTPLDNMADKVSKGRQARGGPGTLLCIEQLENILELRRSGHTYEEIGNKYLVNRRTVARFVESNNEC
jgi:hypothetical protein